MSVLLAALALGAAQPVAAPPPIVGLCRFDTERLSFAGTPAEQARCLMQPVGKRGKLEASPKRLPGTLARVMAGRVELPSREVVTRLLAAERMDIGGVDQPVIGAQAQGYNSVSTGIACIGTFTSVAQSEAGLEALARLIGWKLSLHRVPTEGTVVVTSRGGASNRYPSGMPVTLERISGHRDGDSTSCPGELLYAQLPDLHIACALQGVRLDVAHDIQALRTAAVARS